MGILTAMAFGYIYAKTREDQSRRKFRQDEQWQSMIDSTLSNEKYKRILLAKLIEGVYQHAKKRDHSPYFKKHEYKILEPHEFLDDEDFKKDEVRTALSRGFFLVYSNEKSNADRLESERRPGFVVAVRGTKNLTDLWDDTTLAFEKLHRTKWVICLQLVVERLIQHSKKTRPEYPWDARICLTGHSLGAAVCMLVARKYAVLNDGKEVLDSHLFNPPFFTLANLFDVASSVMESTKLTLVKAIFRDLKPKIQIIEGFVKFELLRPNAEAVKAVMHVHNVLSQWTPYLYINSNDHICSLYNQHFESLRLGKFDTQWFRNLEFYHKSTTHWGAEKLREGSGNAGDNYHLIPRAELRIMNTNAMRPLSAHKLYNWIDPGAIILSQSKALTCPSATQYEEFKIVHVQSVTGTS